MQDISAGDFLVVGLTEDDFGSLTSEQMQKCEEQFQDVYKRQAITTCGIRVSA